MEARIAITPTQPDLGLRYVERLSPFRLASATDAQLRQANQSIWQNPFRELRGGL